VPAIKVGADYPSLIDNFKLQKISVVGARIKLGW
jgi:hypothetical protein